MLPLGYEAIEEAMVNAVYHREYSIREPVEVRILPTEITICRFPGPDRSISMAALCKRSFVSRRYRNRRSRLQKYRLTDKGRKHLESDH